MNLPLAKYLISVSAGFRYLESQNIFKKLEHFFYDLEVIFGEE